MMHRNGEERPPEGRMKTGSNGVCIMLRRLWSSKFGKQPHGRAPRAGTNPIVPQAATMHGDAPRETLEEYWRREMLHIFARNQLRVALAMPLLALLFAAASMVWVSVPVALLWLALYFVVEVVQIMLARRCLQERPRGAAVEDWMLRFSASELAHAAVWFMPLFIFWQPGEGAQHLFIGASLMAAMAIRLLVANNFLPLVTTGGGVIALGVAIRSLMAGETLHLAMAGMIVVLGLFFLQLSRRLQLTTREMLQYRYQREQLIRDLARQRDAAERARQQAEEANRAKSRFLATMSHELRTPLNAIMGFSEIISNEFLGPVAQPRYKEYASDIHRSGSYLLNLIEDILDLSRIEAGRVELQEEVVDVVAEALSAIDMLSMKAEQRGVQVAYIGNERRLELLGNARYIRQIWINLLGNAIKFTPAGGRVSLNVRRLQGGNLALEVSDTGEGIPAAELDKVMQSFSRGASAERRAVEGAGLGLSIVNGLARLHDARVELQSQEGQGTTARVIFPARRVITGARADLVRGKGCENELEHQLILLTA